MHCVKVIGRLVVIPAIERHRAGLLVRVDPKYNAFVLVARRGGNLARSVGRVEVVASCGAVPAVHGDRQGLLLGVDPGGDAFGLVAHFGGELPCGGGGVEVIVLRHCDV